ncbi:MAG TPA: acetoacetyl-CoA reductase [Ramlibacter sp.]|nr:acetoacetyl-CoA reductase [Ramlibacter sp.]
MTAVNRIAAVTGGTGGLGTAICRRLAQAGFEVVALHTAANTRVHEWLVDQEQAGHFMDAVPVDVASFDSCAAAVATIHQRHGPVAVLVNNAGITQDSTFRKMTREQWDTVLRTNLDSMFNMTKQVVEDMIGLGGGRIVNISSVNGQRGAFGQANYAASKAGIHGFTKSLALELARKNITVNTVSPGYLRTRMVEKVSPQVLQERVLPEIPVARLGEPDEVAQLIAYLVSDGAAFVTGANLSINGGQHME